jgi:FkbM family methyltransferase
MSSVWLSRNIKTVHLSKREHKDSGLSGSDATKDTSFYTSSDQVTFSGRETSFRQIFEVTEYWFNDIRPDDRVIDIGANVGAFCIRASRFSRHIVAVEPVTASILRENIRLNGVPVEVIEGALGDGIPEKVRWDDLEVVSPTYPLHTIITMAGGCDFLKCDCEGAEWHITPEDLTGIRRIEMELHIPPISGPPNPALLDYIGRHYSFEIERKPVHAALGVMGVLHAERKA